MKMHRKKLTTTSLTALALSLAPFAIAQEKDRSTPDRANEPSQPYATSPAGAPIGAPAIKPSADPLNLRLTDAIPTGATVRVAADDVEKQTARKLAGHHVRGTDGKDLGTVKDFLIDPQSGDVEFVIVSSGGVAGLGDKLRLVPFAALQPAADKKDEFAIAVGEQAWEQHPVVNDDAFKDGRITLTSDQRKQHQKHFEASSVATTSGSAGMNADLIRASQITGREVRSGATDIGTIEAVVIDQDSRTATALLDPKKDFNNSTQKFLIPLAQLQLAGAQREPVTTQLTSTDFAQFTPGTGAKSDLTPTGLAGIDQIPAGTDPTLITAAQAIRKALDDDASLARVDVQVSPEGGKLILRGTAANAAQMNAIERKALEGSAGQPIDNQIKLKSL